MTLSIDGSDCTCPAHEHMRRQIEDHAADLDNRNLWSEPIQDDPESYFRRKLNLPRGLSSGAG